MALGNPIIVETAQMAWEQASQPWYSQPFQRKLLRRDQATGAVDLLIRYPAGMNAPVHRHACAHTIFVLENELLINGRPYPAGTYAHFPAGERMTHTSSAQRDCTFLISFAGPADFILEEERHEH